MSSDWMPKIGVISMTYARPITAEHIPLFTRMRQAGMDFVELLVPEPGEIDPVLAGQAAREAGLFVVLAARVNVERDLASDDAAAREAGVAYLRRCVDVAVAMGADLVGGPLYGTPLVFAGRPPRPFDAAQRAERVARVVEGLREAGAYAQQLGIERLLAVGALSRAAVDAFTAAGGSAQHFADMDALCAALAPALDAAASVLVKGSRFMRMERAVAALRERADALNTSPTQGAAACC
jgi:D-psicose/D-tagatose/L-ribulose 3-epimerase